MPDFYLSEASEPNLRRFLVRVTGAGTGGSAIEVLGAGLHITYVSTGVFDVIWSSSDDLPGQPNGVVGASFQATTSANVKGYSMTSVPFAAATRSIRVNLWDSTNTLVDLKVNEWVTFEALFRVYK